VAELTGIIPITATPFDAEGRIDEDSIVSLEGQPGIGLALRKEVLRLRGAIRSSDVRPPGPSLDDVTRAELRAILEGSELLAS
jgi:dihydrodipicolinate synthase/N-acetylneuraminate lyase